jgi:hypothetical protein
VSSVTTSPSTSPSATHIYSCLPGCDTLPGCSSGYACAYLSGNNRDWEFQFFNYGGYSLSNWFNTGPLVNHQTGGASVRTYDLSGRQIQCFAPRSASYGVNWNPVWRINLTSTPC